MYSVVSKALVVMLLLATPAWGATIPVFVEDAAVPDLLEACNLLEQIGRKKPGSNADCAHDLILRGVEDLISEVTSRQVRRLERDTVRQRVQAIRNLMPDALVDAVCGDGEIDTVTSETCDNGGANSDTLPDACRTTCQPAQCGDNVVDTGEVCDGAGCLSDCSALE